MQFLLDTHTLLWFLEGNDQLPVSTRKKIIDSNNSCFISIASLWKIAIKMSLDKLSLHFPFSSLANYLDDNEFEILPIDFNHLEQVVSLEFHHRDPFDRIIIAQCIADRLIIITKDKNFNGYPVKRLW
ncbi:MAG: type II toxin-antitoxin system VapC family toxin [Sediminibacterium sp.]